MSITVCQYFCKNFTSDPRRRSETNGSIDKKGARFTRERARKDVSPLFGGSTLADLLFSEVGKKKVDQIVDHISVFVSVGQTGVRRNYDTFERIRNMKQRGLFPFSLLFIVESIRRLNVISVIALIRYTVLR